MHNRRNHHTREDRTMSKDRKTATPIEVLKETLERLLKSCDEMRATLAENVAAEGGTFSWELEAGSGKRLIAAELLIDVYGQGNLIIYDDDRKKLQVRIDGGSWDRMVMLAKELRMSLTQMPVRCSSTCMLSNYIDLQKAQAKAKALRTLDDLLGNK